MYALSLRASNSFPFTAGVSGKELGFEVPLRGIVYTCQWSPSSRVSLEYRRPFAGILLHVPTKYTSAAFICILLSPFLGFFSALIVVVAAERIWDPHFLRSLARSLVRAIRWFCAHIHPSPSAGFNLNEFRRITKVDVCNVVYCHSWAARRGARSNERDVPFPELGRGLICDFAVDGNLPRSLRAA